MKFHRDLSEFNNGNLFDSDFGSGPQPPFGAHFSHVDRVAGSDGNAEPCARQLHQSDQAVNLIKRFMLHLLCWDYVKRIVWFGV